MSIPNSAVLDGYAPDAPILGLTLRPITIGTMDICRLVGLTMFSGEGSGAETPAEQIKQTAGFLWIQSRPLDKVIESAREGLSPDEWHKKHVLPFMFEIAPQDLAAATEEILQRIEAIDLASVAVTPKPGTPEDDAPPNS